MNSKIVIEVTLTAGTTFKTEVVSVNDFIKDIRGSSATNVIHTIKTLGSEVVDMGFSPSQLESFRIVGNSAENKELPDNEDKSNLNATVTPLSSEKLLEKQKEIQPLIDVFEKASKAHKALIESQKPK